MQNVPSDIAIVNARNAIARMRPMLSDCTLSAEDRETARTLIREYAQTAYLPLSFEVHG